jgi:DNA replication initiation complex subunit (GINS family)
MKTLKELHTEAGKFEDSDVDDFKKVLRKEAIEWIKFLQDEYYNKNLEGIKAQAYNEISDPTDVPSFIKLFFNITEEELIK